MNVAAGLADDIDNGDVASAVAEVMVAKMLVGKADRFDPLAGGTKT